MSYYVIYNELDDHAGRNFLPVLIKSPSTDNEDRKVNESFTVNGTPITLINESGLYSLILSNKLPTAKKFKHWVTAEFLPSIPYTWG